MNSEIPKKLQAALMLIRGDHPFLGTLALFAEHRLSKNIETAATDGRVLWFNPTFVGRLETKALCGLIVHELLHAALQHIPRRKHREQKLWNIAADIVVNGMIRSQTRFELPSGGIEEPKLAGLSVEDIYEQLATGKHKVPRLKVLDLLPNLSTSDLTGEQTQSPESNDGHLNLSKNTNLETYWRSALQQAVAVTNRVNRGFGSSGFHTLREITSTSTPTLAWKDILWQFLVSTPFDFGGFDRRFIHKNLYLDEMIGESVEVAICIDTSASIRSRELNAFYAEIQGVLEAYPNLQGKLFFADTDLYGPHDFSLCSMMPAAKGGGGTSFIPFFEWIEQQEVNGLKPVCIYFTDGYGLFPQTQPTYPVLWVVTPGGLITPKFPFGEIARIQEHAAHDERIAPR